MKMFLVDHSYGAGIVIARNKQEAVELADNIGDPYRVIEIAVPLFLHIERIKQECTHSESECECERGILLREDRNGDECDRIEELLAKHEIALSVEEFEQLNRPLDEKEYKKNVDILYRSREPAE